MKKILWTLNINGYSKEITNITYPLLKMYATKIGAEFHVITERKFPDWPITYEKLQIYELAQVHKADWNIYIDSDAIVHPETIDWTEFLRKDTVAHNALDMANVRWRYNDYMRRDGRNIGCCNWLAIASDWCVDLWRPLDVSPDEAVTNIFPTVFERTSVITTEHLVDDYALSNNVARFGLKMKTLEELKKEVGLPDANFFWHCYTETTMEKVRKLQEAITNWKLEYIYGQH
jgi:hypothetical protein